MTNKEKEFIYFASFSAGALGSAAKKNLYLDDIPARFWADDYPEEFKHPYFLLTAGHDYKKMDTRDKFGLRNKGTIAFGDSGGFQIATGALNWEDPKKKIEIREKIFNWLEHNSDIAMNLDIPPRVKYEGQFDHSLKISSDNFKYFYENQSNKTDFLNVLQGSNEAEYQTWYNEVKGYEFQGWSLGGAQGNLYRLMCGLLTLLKGKEHLKDNNKWLHVLGTSRLSDFAVLSRIQKSLNEVGSKMQVTTDSSSPNIASKFGNYYNGFSINHMTFSSIHMPKQVESFEELIKDGNNQLPICTDFDRILNKKLSLSEMTEFTPQSYIGFVHHNLHLFLEAIKKINSYVYSHPYFIKEAFPTDIAKLLDIIDKMIKSDNPEKVFHKNLFFINMFDKKQSQTSNLKTIHNTKFFNKK